MKGKFIYLLSLFLSLCIISSCSAPTIKNGAPSIQKGDFPPDSLGKTLDGHEIQVSDFKGKIMVLIFWKTWCDACRKELLEAKVLQNAYKNKFILCAINIGEPLDVVRRFKRLYRLDFQILVDPQAKISSAYGIRVWPTTILINQHGKVHWTSIGLETELLKQEIELLLGEKQQDWHKN